MSFWANFSGQRGTVLAATLATTGLLRWLKGYRPFPSVDDFSYIPQALARLDSSLFPSDTFVQETPLHLPLLPPLVWFFSGTVGLAIGFWILTVLLSVLTLVAMLRWMRALGVAGALIPCAAIVACSGRVDGLGRGEFEGIFGSAFHFQWVSLCSLMWCYDCLLRQRGKSAAVLLAAAVVSHPVVGVHGLLAAICGLVLGGNNWKYCSMVLGSAVFLSLPVLVQIVPFVGVSHPPHATDLSVVAQQGLLFRLPHEFQIDELRLLLFLMIVAAGICAIVRLQRHSPLGPTTMFLGFMLGHLLLTSAGAVLYSERMMSHWMHLTLFPFQLSLTRTTPLLLVLSSTAIFSAIEAEFVQHRQAGGSQAGLGWLAYWGINGVAIGAIGLFQVIWSRQAIISLVVTFFSVFHCRKGLVIPSTKHVIAWYSLGALGLALFAVEPLDLKIPVEQQQLFVWAREQTPADALFVIPPGFQEFRYYAQRGVYVDFKLVTPGDLSLMPLWRSRLELVAAPDRLAREAAGWDGIAEWDRTYANRNTPARIAWLLQEANAHFLIWDREALRMPPFVELDQSIATEIMVAFENARYRVYCRKLPPSSNQ